MCIHSEDCVAQNWGEEKQRRMGRYDGFTLKKKIRDSRTDEEALLTTLEHASVLEYYRQVQRKEISSVTETRGILF